MRHDKKYFVLQNPTSNFDKKNVNESDTAIYTNKETINIDKENINNNQKQKKDCITVSNQHSNQRHTVDIIETIISNTINNAEPPRNHIQNIEKSEVNIPKQNTKRVYILRDSIIKHIKGYTISSSLDNCKVYVKNFPTARICRTMFDQL